MPDSTADPVADSASDPGRPPATSPAASPTASVGDAPITAGLFVTCLVNLFRPAVARATVRLLERAGCRVVVVRQQTCCGQPSYNGGDRKSAVRAARQMIELFEGVEYVVVPSGSCAAMIRTHYPALLAADENWRARAGKMAAKCYELTQFLTTVVNFAEPSPRPALKATYHDSCSGLRELHIKTGPRALLARVAGLELVELRDPEQCCGFGGAFCIKFPELSHDMTARKIHDIRDSGADCVIGGDLGCLMTLEGQLHREGSTIRVHHIAEILAEPEGET